MFVRQRLPYKPSFAPQAKGFQWTILPLKLFLLWSQYSWFVYFRHVWMEARMLFWHLSSCCVTLLPLLRFCTRSDTHIYTRVIIQRKATWRGSHSSETNEIERYIYNNYRAGEREHTARECKQDIYRVMCVYMYVCV